MRENIISFGYPSFAEYFLEGENCLSEGWWRVGEREGGGGAERGRRGPEAMFEEGDRS